MKKIIIATLIVILSIFALAKPLRSESVEPQQISYVQCVLVDNKVQSCTDITDGKVIDTAMVRSTLNK